MSPLVDICPFEELPPGEKRLVEVEDLEIGVYNCDGTLLAIEDRCSHDDGPLCLGNWDDAACTVVCPRHGASFDLASGRALTLPAYLPVRTFPVRIEDGVVTVELDDCGPEGRPGTGPLLADGRRGVPALPRRG